MRPTGSRSARPHQAFGLMLGLAALAWVSGCASTRPQPPALTGNILVDGPNAIGHGPPRDRVLWEYRTAAAAMRQGQFDLARQYLDSALTTLQGIYGPNPNARKARSYFHGEAKKTFIGEPYERSMAYIYRGILYWMDHQVDNARACFRSAEIEDSDAASHQYAGDWVLPDYLDGLATAKLGGDGTDALRRAQGSARNLKLPALDPKANLLLFVEFGSGPGKYATGQYDQELRFYVSPPLVRSAQIEVDGQIYPMAPSDDVWFQASTRGGRVMDHVLGNKAVFKSATDVAGNVALVGGLGTAAFSGNRTAQEVGLGVALAGLLTKVVSAAVEPAADTRAWDNLPRYLSFANLELLPGQHTVKVEFLDAAGFPLQNLTKTLTVEVPADGKDKAVFVSDQSLTPQTI